jgi:hypothetical protein
MNKKLVALVYKLEEKSETKTDTLIEQKNNHKPTLTAESKKHKN